MRRGEVVKGSKTALVTGASTGIGRCYAEQLAALGYNLIIVSRDGELLNKAAREITDTHGVKVSVLAKNLATLTAAEELYEWTKSEGHTVNVLINNAGMFSFCDILDTPTERIKETILLHDVTNTMLCKLFAADMASRGGGHILNMSSYSIWMPWPGLSLYSASKAYLKSFSVAFAKEVREKKVYVTAVCPAGIATDLYGLSKKWQKIGLNIHALSTPKFCARRGLNSLWRRRRSVVPDWWMRLLIPILEYLPMFILRWMRGFTKKWQK
ncbi:MAG: SDR family NAD(P)-dependent oxidoreductase [Alistipes sp.]|nr:SDR family NAD(P)-dependent oxidoreductase [Alistipes sp.]MBR2116931.1 SDR family NAD(P)-dependent oxidoreductase [Alistipes sp.]